MIKPEARQQNPLYRLARGLVAIYFRIASRWEIYGAEFVPSTGPVVIAANHVHNFDPFVLGASTSRYVQFMAKEELFRLPPIGKFFRFLGAFPIRRGAADTRALKYSVKILNESGCLVIFPEGHRSKTGKLGPGLPGTALIARKAQCPIVPAAVLGTYRFRDRLIIRFGEPFMPEQDDTNERLLERLMSRIALLLEREQGW